MTGKTLSREELHRTYGGELTLFDFEGHHTMSTIAKKIKRDESFDKMCKTNFRKEWSK